MIEPQTGISIASTGRPWIASWGVAAIAVALGLAYIGRTHHVWEDYFITFRHSRNLAEGNGLVFQPGERIHGFTSPLGVLLPAGFHRLFGNPDSHMPALAAFRAVSLATLALGAAQAVRWLLGATPPTALAVAVGAVLVGDPKVIGFAVNGQEAGWMFAWVAMALAIGNDPSPSAWRRLGVVWAGLQWTRPDGFVFGGAVAVAELICPGTVARRPLLVRFAKAAGLALLLYAPWLAFATIYYGSPIPHTIVAKSGLMPRPATVYEWKQSFVDRFAWFLMPTNAFFGGWPAPAPRIARMLGLAGAFVWLVAPWDARGRAARRASLAYLVVLIYFCVIPMAAWYLSPAILLLLGGLVALALAAPMRAGWFLVACYAGTVLIEENRLRIGHSLQNTLLIAGGLWAAACWLLPRLALKWVVLAAYLTFLVPIHVLAVRQIAVQQRVIETEHRRQIGAWLHDHVRADETVYVECLGYIGYFSGCRMLDFPGLATPRVVAAHRARTWETADLPVVRMIKLIPDLDPDWLVMRPHEWSWADRVPGLKERYELVQEFDVGPRLDAEFAELPGLAYLKADAKFSVFRKRR